MVAAGHAHGDRQLRVVVLDADLARAEQLELQAAAQAGLVDVGQQGVHLGLAGQLLFELGHVLLHLLALLLQRVEVDGLRQLLLVVLAQRRLPCACSASSSSSELVSQTNHSATTMPATSDGHAQRDSAAPAGQTDGIVRIAGPGTGRRSAAWAAQRCRVLGMRVGVAMMTLRPWPAPLRRRRRWHAGAAPAGRGGGLGLAGRSSRRACVKFATRRWSRGAQADVAGGDFDQLRPAQPGAVVAQVAQQFGDALVGLRHAREA